MENFGEKIDLPIKIVVLNLIDDNILSGEEVLKWDIDNMFMSLNELQLKRNDLYDNITAMFKMKTDNSDINRAIIKGNVFVQFCASEIIERILALYSEKNYSEKEFHEDIINEKNMKEILQSSFQNKDTERTLNNIKEFIKMEGERK